MAVKIRNFREWCAKLVPLALAVVWFGISTPAQVNTETPQQANEKIRQLAAQAPRPEGTPIGVGDLIHVDVFDVPELSRDIRVSDSGVVSFPLIPEKIPVA